MKFTVLTIFPELFEPFCTHGIVRRALESQKAQVETLDVRDFTADRHRTTDDRPYGGGCGMVMKPEPLAAAIQHARRQSPSASTVMLSPQGKRFDQRLAEDLCLRGQDLILICGRYEGVDDRIVAGYIDHEISIGDFVLTGGELAAMVIVDAVVRLIPGVLGGADSAQKDTFSDGLLEHPQYTRPSRFKGEDVPEVLLSGHHERIERWRLEQSLIRTALKRPDLLADRPLQPGEAEILKGWCERIRKLMGE